MRINTSLQPIAEAQFDEAAARHLLRRAGFGGTADEVKTLHGKGLAGAVDHLVDYEAIKAPDLKPPEVNPDFIRPATPEERDAYGKARKEKDEKQLDMIRKARQKRQRGDRQQMQELQDAWLERMIDTPRALQEKLTLLWHGHFATGYRKVRDSYLMHVQNEMFRKYANGSFPQLAHGIIRDPAMLRYLDNNRNVKRRPNENLARELMELFTLGEGHYSEHDIREGARALTGYTYNDNDFTYAKRIHDDGSKTILGVKDRHDGESFVNLLLRQPACARFIAYKLYRHFVADVDIDDLPRPAAAVIVDLAKALMANEGRIKPTLKVLFKSRHFYDAAVVGNKIKSPAELVVCAMRSLRRPQRNMRALQQAMTMMGQTLFNPPSVAGWDGGRAWINTSTLLVRQNTMAYIVTGRNRRQRGSASPLDTETITEGANSTKPDTVAEYLIEQLVPGAVSRAARQQLVAFARKKGVKDRRAVAGLLLLITALPEYQLI